MRGLWGPGALGTLLLATGCGGAGTHSLSPVDLEPPAAAAAPSFDADRAFADLKKQVEFGPRTPGAPGHVACREYLERVLRTAGAAVERQDFVRKFESRTLPMTNVIARWKGRSGSPGVLLCTHWDTRPTADNEADPGKRRKPIPGANDGASGTAVLLELARQFQQSPPEVPVMMVFFDGEDWGPGVDRMFLGSRHFAAHLPKDVPQRGVLIDMIGDKDLVVPKEPFSVRNAPNVVRSVYDTAIRLGYRQQFPDVQQGPVEDDHLPLLEKGLQVIDLIDFDYGPGNSWWHTHQDTPDKCSPASLKVVGTLLREWIRTQPEG